MFRLTFQYFLLVALLTSTISYAQESQNQQWDLQQCVSHALTNNLTVSQSYLKQRSSELQYNQSKLNRLPSVNASASQSLLEPTSSSIGLSASMNLFNGFNTENTIKKNKLEFDKQALQTEQAKYEIEIAVAEAYLQCLYYKDNIKTAEKTLESSADELRVAEAKFKVGSIAKKDYTDIKAQYANNEYSLIRAKNTYAQQILTLKQLLELAPGENIEIYEPEIENVAFEVPAPIDVFNEACQTLPEIRNAEQQLAIDSISLKIAKSAYYPSLSLSAGVGANGDFFDNESEWSGNKSLRLSLSVPIFNKWQTKTNVETTKINSEYNVLAIESTKKKLYKEIEQACQNAEAYQKELEALQMSLEAAEESYQLAQKQFSVGATNATALLLAESKFIEVSLSQIQAKYMAILSRIVIDHYQGKSISL
ncbi:MAG: TolC family protein [Bacteroidales bacterium]|nr:TolC family protein [Bacteroidales bacterium]